MCGQVVRVGVDCMIWALEEDELIRETDIGFQERVAKGAEPAHPTATGRGGSGVATGEDVE